MININQLPFLATQNIFCYLNLNQKAKASQVCRRWAYEINLLKSNKLCLVNGSEYEYGNRFAYTREIIGYQNSVLNFGNLNKFKISKQIGIKKLYITNTFPITYRIGFLNQLKGLELEQLEINSFSLDYISLDCPTLKILSIQDCSMNAATFDLPALEVFIFHPKFTFRSTFNDRKQFPDFKYKLSLKHLETSDFYPQIKMFKNLEVLICKKIDNSDLESINELPKLRQLQVIKRLKKPLNISMQIAIEKESSKFLFLNGVADKHSQSSRFSFDEDVELFFVSAKTLRKVIDQLSKQCYVPFATSLYFNGLNSQLTNHQLHSVVLKKLINIRRIEVFGSSTNEKELVDFLSKCGPNIKYLELSQTSLTQSFYDQLSRLKSIERLEINELFKWKIKSYKFLAGLTNLKKIKFYYDGALGLSALTNFIDNAFKKSKSLEIFEFGRQYSNAEIARSGRKLYFGASFILPENFKKVTIDISVFFNQLEDINSEFFFKLNSGESEELVDVLAD